MKRGVNYRISNPNAAKILNAFNFPKTPRQVEREFLIKKLKIRPFIEKGLLRPLNQGARKGRLYVLTEKAKSDLNLNNCNNNIKHDWATIGWIIASPRQRKVLLQTMTMDSVKRTSEEIRRRAAKFNPNLTRISTKQVLNQLWKNQLVDTEKYLKYRHYWISNKGKQIAETIKSIEARVY